MPCPEPMQCPIQMPCCECPDCLIAPGIIYGCVWGCDCCKPHEWEVSLYQICNDKKILLYCEKIDYCDCFEFEVPFEGCYLLEVCPPRFYRKSGMCKPIIELKNVGVSNFIIG
jgi:hypothetical protein